MSGSGSGIPKCATRRQWFRQSAECGRRGGFSSGQTIDRGILPAADRCVFSVRCRDEFRPAPGRSFRFPAPSLIDPTNDVRVGAFAFADLRNNVGVEQESHELTVRQPSPRGWSKTPLKAASGRSEPKTSKAVSFPGACRALVRVDRRASARSDPSRSVSATARSNGHPSCSPGPRRRTRPRAAARRLWVRVALRWDLVDIACLQCPVCNRNIVDDNLSVQAWRGTRFGSCRLPSRQLWQPHHNAAYSAAGRAAID